MKGASCRHAITLMELLVFIGGVALIMALVVPLEHRIFWDTVLFPTAEEKLGIVAEVGDLLIVTEKEGVGLGKFTPGIWQFSGMFDGGDEEQACFDGAEFVYDPDKNEFRRKMLKFTYTELKAESGRANFEPVITGSPKFDEVNRQFFVDYIRSFGTESLGSLDTRRADSK